MINKDKVKLNNANILAIWREEINKLPEGSVRRQVLSNRLSVVQYNLDRLVFEIDDPSLA